jgi:hypothetical protein
METWLLVVVMALATYRLTRFVVEDDFPPMLWVRERLVGGWKPLTEAECGLLLSDLLPTSYGPLEKIDDRPHRFVHRASWSPKWLADLLSCPWCASGWIAAGVTAGTWAVVGLPVPLLVWPAVWAAGALLAAQEWA